MADLIHVNFKPEFFDELQQAIKYSGVKRVEKYMLDLGHNPSFVKAAIKRIIKYRGW